VRALTAAQPTK